MNLLLSVQEIFSTEIESLDKMQDFFWRVMLRVPESCPRIALRAETCMMGMKHRIWQDKLLLLKRIRAQSQDTLSRKILEEQRRNKWPGLSVEVSDICEELNLPDINNVDITGGEIKEAVFNHHYLEVKSKIENSKKMMAHKDDNFKEFQPYMKGKSVENVRLAFRIRCEMVKDIRGNYKDKYRRIKQHARSSEIFSKDAVREVKGQDWLKWSCTISLLSC